MAALSQHRWRSCVLGLVLSAAGPALAFPTAPRFNVASWTVDDGLPDSAVSCILQTQDGYLWLGTPTGLARFDGLRFVVYDENNTPGLRSRRILRLYEDARTNLWISTGDAGVFLVSPMGRIANVDFGRAQLEGPAKTICEDRTGAVWMYTTKGVLGRYHENIGDVWRVGAEYPSFCRALMVEDSGLLWVGTDKALYFMDPSQVMPHRDLPLHELSVRQLDYLLPSPKGGYWRFADGRIQKWNADKLASDLAPYPWSSTTKVMAACEDREGNLVVGTYGDGAYRVELDGRAERLQGLSHSSILSLAVDREGCLWVGSNGGGLSRLRPLIFGVLTNTVGFTVQTVCEGTDHDLWIGYNGNGRVDHCRGDTVEQVTLGAGDSDLAIRSLFVDRQQTLWAGTEPGGLYVRQDGHFQTAPGLERCSQVSAIFQDRRGILLVGTPEWLARRYDSRWTLIAVPGVKAITDDRAGALWLGTDGAGLLRVDKNGPASFNVTNGLPSDHVSSLWMDEEDVLWIGTSRGLVRFHQGQWTSYGTSEPLLSDGIGYLIGDPQGYLWIASRSGMMRVARKELNAFADGSRKNPVAIRVYEKSDGLPSSQCTQGSQPAACRTQDGRLWFPTIKGLAWVDPARLRTNTNPPPVRIESVHIDGPRTLLNGPPATLRGLRVPEPQAITVPARKEGLEITFTSLNLGAPEKGRFRYRLRDHEEAWIETAWNVRRVHYSRLPAGHFLFEVQACNEDGVWSDPGATLIIEVLPPFWRTWWFVTAVTLGCLGLVVASVHYVSTQRLQRQLASLRQKEAVEKERARIARDIHDQLGANLTQVSLLGEMVEADRNHPAEVAAHARQISHTALETTRALDEIVWTVNPSNDTLDGLITYLCKYAQEYLAVAGLRYRLDVPADLPASPISPDIRHNVFLAAKEALTNVVRHSKATAACLRLRLNPGDFTIEIEDNGRGLAHLDPNARQTRNGLRNMRKRMEDVGGEFAMVPGSQGGAIVRLTAPLKNAGPGAK